MEKSKRLFCRLCTNTKSDGNFRAIDESTREILKTVSLNLDLDNYKHVICSICSVQLYSAFDFKSTCLYVEDKIVSYVNPTMSFVDLKEVYVKEHDNKPLIKMEDDQKICRLCLQLVSEEFVPFSEVDLEMFHRYIPEVDTGVSEDPIICKQCFDSLGVHNIFIKTCLDVKMQIHTNEIGSEDEQKMEGLVKIEKELDTEETLIGTEEVHITSEGHDWERWIPTTTLYYATERDLTAKELEQPRIHRKAINTYIGDSILPDLQDKTVKQQSNKKKCETEEIQSNTPLDIPFSNSKCKNEFNNGLKHEAVPELIQYKRSNTCTFETKCKRGLSGHCLKHKGLSEIQMYKCDTCTYTTKYKLALTRHQLLHKHSSENQIHKCDTCSYKTKRKSNLKVHQLSHKDPSEIKMYKCDVCTYETKRKCHLIGHQMTHKDLSQTEMYKCELCTYEAKYKVGLKRHQLIHKPSSEIEIYNCDACTYETKHKSDLKVHLLLHKDPSEIRMYKCDQCSYEAKRASYLKLHQLSHKDPSETKMYKCELCSYESKYKTSFKRHRLTRKHSSKIQK
ncbi:zinc finger protein 90-like [Anoplophora glabripennis]|uniref:zinc finger protein 90-like n=1 Tax=Anoplophora glabripennis TaxID=217634 RepID=UPI0008745433|nr:zinc finger protein 90-like [Anoplophora glabripennis]